MAARVDVIKMRMRELEQELAQIEQFGSDEFPSGTVIRWKRKFGGGRKYTYAAVKAGGSWYLTNREGYAMSWDRLVQTLNGSGVSGVKIATEWKRLDATSGAGAVHVQVRMPFGAEQVVEGVQ